MWELIATCEDVHETDVCQLIGSWCAWMTVDAPRHSGRNVSIHVNAAGGWQGDSHTGLKSRPYFDLMIPAL